MKTKEGGKTIKIFWKRTLPTLILTIALCVSLTVPAFAQVAPTFTSGPQEIDFKSIKPTKPDTAAFDTVANRLEAALDQEEDAETVAELVAQLNKCHAQTVTEYFIFHYYYKCDPAGYSEEYTTWENAIMTTSNRADALIARLIKPQYMEAVVKIFGADAVAYIRDAEEDTPEEMALFKRKAELVNEYHQNAQKTYSAVYDGKVYYTQEDVMADVEDGKLDQDQANVILLDFAKQSNADQGVLFLELIEVLNQYAKLKGFSNYGEYAYQAELGRDFTMEDAQKIHTLIKKYFAPLYKKSEIISISAPTVTAGVESAEEQFSAPNQAKLVAMVQPYMDDISSELAELFDYMLRCNLLDAEPSDTKSAGAFSAGLPIYQSAMIYMKPGGNVFDASILVHEFGHFAAQCMNEGQLVNGGADILEIHSQGLELLYLPYAEAMMGPGTAYYRAEIIRNILYSVISGSFVDEFLQKAFTTPDLTLDKLNRLYHDILGSYGIVTADDTYSYSWTDIYHNFEVPFQYISYATSALAALQLFEQSLTDYDVACDNYINIAKQGVKAGCGFRQTLELAQLDDVFAEETAATTAEMVENYLYETVCGVNFSDIADTWARDDIRCGTALGLFEGSAGKFAPSETLTRAQMATLLWRMSGEEDAKYTANFQDVPKNAWYTNAVEWCAGSGIITGTSATTFSPDTAVTRQELTLALYRAQGSPAEFSELVISDQEEIAGWALDSMRWAVEAGIIQGRPGGKLAPADVLTRAEAATLLNRALN